MILGHVGGNQFDSNDFPWIELSDSEWRFLIQYVDASLNKA